MSRLLQKSNDSLQACQVLIEHHKLYTSSVHHAYYSSLQRSIYLLETYFPESVPKKEDGDSHVLVINTLEQKLRNNGYPRTVSLFDYCQQINDLKRRRVNADYKNNSFGATASQESLKIASSINTLLDEFGEKLKSPID